MAAAYEIPLLRVSHPASGDLTGKEHHGFVLDGNGQVDATPTAGGAIDGVILHYTASVAGRAVACEVGDGATVMMTAGEAIAVNDDLAIKADGRFATATAGQTIVGRALQAASGDGSVFAGRFIRTGETA